MTRGICGECIQWGKVGSVQGEIGDAFFPGDIGVDVVHSV